MTDFFCAGKTEAASQPGAQASAMRLIVTGNVQGLGVRPSVFLLAREMRLAGVVRNTSRGVEIEVEGPHERLLELARRLPDALPAGAWIERLCCEPMAPSGRVEFAIERRPAHGPLTARVPADRAACRDCLEEVSQPGQRRFRYPLTSCTACGPRFTIIRGMPYERPDTTMSGFPFCASCRGEYERPGDRRLHAQTNACPECGPHVWAVDRAGRAIGRGDAAVQAAASALRAGRIVALRGLGGYQLLADAASDEAVRRLRRRKGRPAKPLAVMAATAEHAARYALVDATERRTLADPSNPIVLLRARDDSPLAPSVRPQLDTVGLLLPTTPLHALLLQDVQRPLLCTSGNRDGEPLEYEVPGAEQRLAGVCDLYLHHDRPIARPVDDSVVRVIAGRPVTIRLARGLAPLPLDLPAGAPALAVGGHSKSAAAWSNGRQAVLGPHIGDQESLAVRRRFLDQTADLKRLYQFEPETLVHDMHPEYFSTQWAFSQDRRRLAVQHHHAHIAAGMLEHGWLDRTVLGVSWDGTGYGLDGGVWGGELLVAKAGSFERVGRLRPFALPGGQAAIHQPWRVALSLAADAVGRAELDRLPLAGIGAARRALVSSILDRPAFSPVATSAGRLFDAAAAMILDMPQAEFEGQPAMVLEAVADRDAPGQYRFPARAGPPIELDWRPLVADLLADCRRGADPGALSMRFHRAVASAIAAACRRRADLPVVLGGGVFQNRLLTELLLEMLDGDDRRIGLPGVIPPNDGGLAAGQLAVAAAQKEIW